MYLTKIVKVRNKIYSMILILTLILTQFIPAFADNVNEFEVDGNGVLLKYTGNNTIVTIPDNVKSIGEKAFEKNTNIMRVDFGANVESIGKGGFASCTSLKTVNLNDGLVSIGEQAFKGCKNMKYIHLPETVRELGAMAFYSSGIQYVKLPENILEVPKQCFYNSQLRGIALNENLKTIGDSALETCYKLQGLIVPASVETIGNSAIGDNGSDFKWLVVKNKDTVVPKYLTDSMSITYYGEQDSNIKKLYDAIYNKNNNTKLKFEDISNFKSQDDINLVTESVNMFGGEEYQIQASIVPQETTETRLNYISQNPEIADVDATGKIRSFKIGRAKIMVFSAEKMKEMEVVVSQKDGNPFEVTAEGELIGYYGVDKDIIIPDEVKSINKTAFNGNSTITSVKFGAKLNEIKREAFKDCKSLKEVDFEKSENLNIIGAHAFEKCVNIKNIKLPKSVDTIGESAFIQCERLEKIEFGANKKLKKIEANLFNGCQALNQVVLPETVEEIGKGAFSGNRAMTEIKLNKGINKIGQYAFSKCTSLVELTIPEGVVYIEKGAFQQTDSLLKLNLPKTFKAVIDENGNAAGFSTVIDNVEGRNDDKLKEINIAEGNQFYYSHQGIVYTKDNKLAYIPCGITHAKVKDGTVEVLAGVARGHMNLVQVTIPKTVLKLGDSAFQNCFGLESAFLPDEITEIGDACFLGCEELKTIKIPKSVKKIGKLCFYELENVKSLVVPDGVDRLEPYAVAGNDNMEHLILSRNIEFISDNGCSFCPSLKELYLPEKLKHIGKQGFGKLSGVTHLELPQSLSQVLDEGFSYADSLKSIYIPNTVNLGENIFKGLKAEQKVDVFSHEPNDSIIKLCQGANFSLHDLDYVKDVKRKVEIHGLENILGANQAAKFELKIKEGKTDKKDVSIEMKLSEDGKAIQTLNKPLTMVIELNPKEESKEFTPVLVTDKGEKTLEFNRLDRFIRVDIKDIGKVVLKPKAKVDKFENHFSPIKKDDKKENKEAPKKVKGIKVDEETLKKIKDRELDKLILTYHKATVWLSKEALEVLSEGYDLNEIIYEVRATKTKSKLLKQYADRVKLSSVSYNFALKIDGKKVKEIGGRSLKVKIPYKSNKTKDKGVVRVLDINSGKFIKGRYNKKDKIVEIKTKTLSKYVIAIA